MTLTVSTSKPIYSQFEDVFIYARLAIDPSSPEDLISDEVNGNFVQVGGEPFMADYNPPIVPQAHPVILELLDLAPTPGVLHAGEFIDFLYARLIPAHQIPIGVKFVPTLDVRRDNSGVEPNFKLLANDITFEVQAASVPEPATLGLFGFGLVALRHRLTRRRRA